MATLLRGALARDDYIVLLANLHALYGALEAALARHPEIARIDFTPLARRDAIARDLAFLAPGGTPALMPATREMLQRVRQIEADDPRLLLAHAYVRYLGDLHGGQVLRGRIAKMLGLTGDDGTRFYDFGDASKVERLIAALRHGLDGCPLDATQVDAQVDEARLSFRLHVALFRQLSH